MLGDYIKNFKEKKALPLHAKLVSISLLWITILYASFFAIDILWIQILLLCVAIGVTWHISSFKTLKEEK